MFSPVVKELPVFFDTLATTATQRADIADSLVFSKMWEHGIAIVELDAENMDVSFHNVNAKVKGVNTAQISFYDDKLTYLEMVKIHKFRVKDNNLQRLS